MSPRSNTRPPTARSRPRQCCDRLAPELLLDLVDQLEVQFEQPAEEAVHELQVFLAMRQQRCAEFGIVQPQLNVGDVVAKGEQALAGELLPDEVADQQAEERLALERGERDRGSRVVAQRLEPLVRERVHGAL